MAKGKKFNVISPQAHMINNVMQRAAHLASKGGNGNPSPSEPEDEAGSHTPEQPGTPSGTSRRQSMKDGPGVLRASATNRQSLTVPNASISRQSSAHSTRSEGRRSSIANIARKVDDASRRAGARRISNAYAKQFQQQQRGDDGGSGASPTGVDVESGVATVIVTGAEGFGNEQPKQAAPRLSAVQKRNDFFAATVEEVPHEEE
ncbi:hypothetical protein HK102_000616 [Quaeritorhiza haematococci]|nr:hypothetical protein HK102_000616 [Quaeritorhiza haematococci]